MPFGEPGAWTREDPKGFEGQDVDLYRFVNNDPTIFIDPFGSDGLTRFWGGVKVVAGVALLGASVEAPFLLPITGLVAGDWIYSGAQEFYDGNSHPSYTGRLIGLENERIASFTVATMGSDAVVIRVVAPRRVSVPAPPRRVSVPAPGRVGTLHDANVLMGNNLPPGMTRAQFGELMQWGGGHATARAQIGALSAQELRAAGVTAEMAENWAAAYEGIARITPANPSAAGRADLMRWVAQLLRGQ